MAETPEPNAVPSPGEQEDANTEPVKEETALSEELEKALDISQDVGPSECSVSEETDSKEKPELDAQTVSAEPSSESKVNLQRQTPRSDAALQTQGPDCQDWKSGSRCRAVYSGDGLVYPALILWVKGQRCCVRYDDYNNEEEQDVSSLLNINEFLGPNRATAAKGGVRKTGVSSRGAERRPGWRDDQHSSSWVRERAGHQGKTEREEKKKDGDKGTSHSFPFFPPFPPPLQSNSGDTQSFVPPPPPPPPSSWAGGGKEFAGVDSATSMLTLWYMCGFHTGSYLAQQAFRSSSKD